MIKQWCLSDKNDCIAQGNDDNGDSWCAVAQNTQWGTIPGKAKDGTCWYSYGGVEYTTKDFKYVLSGNV